MDIIDLTTISAETTDETPKNEATERRRRKKRRKERPPKKEDPQLRPAALALLVVVLLGLVVVGMMLSPFCAIDHVEVEGITLLSKDKVIEEIGDPTGKNLFLYRTGPAEETLSYNLYVRDVTIKRQPIDTLRIIIDERQPIGVLVDNGVYLQFSADGMLMHSTESLDDTDLPIITGLSLSSVPPPGGYINDGGFKNALSIVNACSPELQRLLQEINIADAADIMAYTGQGIEVRIGSSENVQQRMAVLEDILMQLVVSGTIEGDIEYIDVRYDKAPAIKIKGLEHAVSPAAAATSAAGTGGTTPSTATGQTTTANQAAGTASGEQAPGATAPQNTQAANNTAG